MKQQKLRIQNKHELIELRKLENNKKLEFFKEYQSIVDKDIQDDGPLKVVNPLIYASEMYMKK